VSFLNTPWRWDTGGFSRAPADVSVRRWRRGPVTFYRYTIHLSESGTHTAWWIYVADDFGFAIHIPAWIMNWVTDGNGKDPT